ncbi:hypothetical protein MOQ72_38660 [Saccharopolyspora sp. K220]|uniref:SWIM zinc finger family protein n=1 Tax=Saccharopolyspora soli TaxID=2926618 RepID=UPI001F5AAC44|nr:DUF6880 family protein [Saccharopolyspora soli]MCI2423358.1 hypothetical protein [Saccharopolyspora soli]
MAWFSKADLRVLAGDRSFERGLGYLAAVTNVGSLPDGVVGTVHGTASYRARLRNVGGSLAGTCSCPYGREGAFCKHCVALGLRVLTTESESPAQATDMRAFLETLDRSALVDLIWQQAQDDAALYQRLLLFMATESARPDSSVLGVQVDQLKVDWINYGDEDAYAANATAVLDALGRLIPTRSEVVQPLLRRALTHIGAAASACEDVTGTVVAVAERAWRLYLDSCRLVPPDQAELGRWLVDFHLDGPEWPEVELDEVVDLLGEPGLAAYRLGLEQTGSKRNDWRFRWLREQFVAATGGTDELVACLAEQLSGPHDYVRIATLLREDGRLDEAVEWLQRGHRAEGRWDARSYGLVDLLVELHQECGRDSDALELLEAKFTDAPAEDTYRQWREAAERVGRWQHLREQAHRVLRERAEARAFRAAETLARILLAEGDIEASWQVVQRYRCDESTRLAVADRRAETHPADAIAIYRPVVDTAIAETNKHSYQRAAQLLTTLRDLHSRIGTESDFEADVRSLKDAHRRKRSLLAILADQGL